MAAWPFYVRVVSIYPRYIRCLSQRSRNMTYKKVNLVMVKAHLTNDWGKWRRSCQIKSVWKKYISINQM